MTLDAGDSDTNRKLASAKRICYGLQSEDRKIRKQTLVDLQNLLTEEEFDTDELRNIFNETHMYTLNSLRDKTENVRDQGIKFMTFFIIDMLPLNDFYLTYVFPVLVERIGSVELVEESEEIRLCLLQFLYGVIQKYSNTEQLKPFLNDCVTILCETVKDKYPAIKELSCHCIVALAHALPRDFHMQAETLLKPVLTCFPHQRFKVRMEGIKCIGEILLHCTYKGVEIVMVPMAEKLFDQIPIVRRTVAQVASKWLLDYRDRYSFFHKLLPLLMTGLNDEVAETREEAHKLWEIVGLQYQQENEKDLKDQMDFLIEPPKYYLEHLKRPNLGCRVLVQRHLGKLANALSNELPSWQADIRVRCSQLLCSVALHAEDFFTMHLQALLPAMFSAARDSDSRVVVNIVQAAEIIGLFVPYPTWSKIMLPQVENCPHYGHLTVLRSLIKGAPKELIGESLGEVTEILSVDAICYSRKKKFQIEMVACVQAICDKYVAKEGSQVGYQMFKILIAMISLKDVENELTITVKSLEKLGDTLGMENSHALWSEYLGKLLEDIDVDPKAWTVVTSERCILEIVLTESGEAFGENLPAILSILKLTLNVDADAESRLKTFLALTLAFEDKEVIFKRAGADLSKFFEDLISDVFVPSLVWHAGRTAEAMRTMVATCLKTALTPTEGVDLFAEGPVLRLLFDQLLPLLLSLIEDAAYRSRQLSMECLVLLKRIAALKNIWAVEDLVKIYPEVLKRLDDPTEKVRQCAIQILPRLLDECPADFKTPTYKAHHEFILDTLLTHFDDDEEHIQDMIFEALKSMASIDKEYLIAKIHRHRPVLRNQAGCDQVLATFA